MRLKTFKRLALVSGITTVLAACGGSHSSDPMAAATQVSDVEQNWVDQPASIKWDGADAESAAELKARRRNRDGRQGSNNSNTTNNGTSTGSTTTGSTTTGSTTTGSTNTGTTTTDSGSTGGSTTGASTTEGGSTGSTTTGSTTTGSTTTGNTTTGNATTGNTTTGNTATVAPAASTDYSGPAGATSGSYGSVTFDEEWNGSLDTSKWNTRMPHWNDSIPDLDNWKIEDGKIKIWTPKQSNGEFLYENRAFTTYEKFNQRYGWFEMEAKLPPGQGMWPSFWLYGIFGTERPEIDIMESHGGVDEWWGDPNPIDYGATVWMGHLSGNHEMLGMVRPTHYGLTPGDLTTGFHKYGALWEPDGVTFYFDGQKIGDKIRTTRMDREMWIILGLGTGRPGDYNGPTSRTPTNSELEVNYVRAWALPGGQTTVNGSTVN